jgi:hypothetical protein
MTSDTTPTEVWVEDVPIDKKYGSLNKRIARVIIGATAGATSSATDLSTYVPGVSGILGAQGIVSTGVAATAYSVSTSVFTYGYAGAGTYTVTVFF